MAITSPLPILFTDAGTQNASGIWLSDSLGLWGKIQRWGMLPLKQSTYQYQDYIQTMQDIFAEDVLPLIQSLNEEYFVQPLLIPTAGLSGPLSVPIPSSSMGLDLRSVWMQTGNGSPNEQNALQKATRVNPDQIPLYSTVPFNWAPFGGPLYYVQNNAIIFPYPVAPQFSQILINFYQKPNNLCSRYLCALVTSVDLVNNLIYLDNSNQSNPNPNSTGQYGPFYQGQSFDFIVPSVPFPFRYSTTASAYQVTPTVVTTSGTGTILQVTADIANLVQVGDICCPTGVAPVTQYVPEEAWLYLARRVVCQIMSSISDAPGKADAEANASRAKDSLVRLLTPKITSETKTLVSQQDVSSCISGALYAGIGVGGL